MEHKKLLHRFWPRLMLHALLLCAVNGVITGAVCVFAASGVYHILTLFYTPGHSGSGRVGNLSKVTGRKWPAGPPVRLSGMWQLYLCVPPAVLAEWMGGWMH